MRDTKRDFNEALCYFGSDPTRKAMLAAFWFIENVDAKDPNRTELFFKVRELVRKGADSNSSNAEKACFAVAARINGVWDNECLLAFGPLSTDTISDVQEILEHYSVG